MSEKLSIHTIVQEVSRLKKKYAESDPSQLARDMKIMVAYEPMGVYDGCCKGFFLVHSRIRHITVNSDLPEQLQKVILSHELGHAVLHAHSGSMAAFHEMTLFDTADQKEYEANLFASELLLTDQEVLDLLNEDLFFFQAASALNVPAEVLDFKFRVMKRKGYKVNSPITANSDYLKKIEKVVCP